MRPSDAVAYKRMLIRLVKGISARHFDSDENLLEPDRDPSGGHAPDFRDQSLQLSHYLPQSPTYFVTADMVAVAKAAGRTLPVETLTRTCLPSPTGFMAFDAPIARASFADADVDVVGVTWELFECLGHDSPDPNEDGTPRKWPDCVCPDEDFHPDCPHVSPDEFVEIAPLALMTGQLLPIGHYSWEIGDEHPEAVCPENDSPHLDDGNPLLATWVLMQQSITVAEHTRADRHQRKVNGKLQLPSDLVIVRLRRIENKGDSSDESSVAWTHQWLVSGHWRQQFYPSDGTNRPKWISPYVKGPEHKPLVVKEKVTAWVR